MKKYLSVISSFVIMLCLGGVYAWSIIASELMDAYAFSAAQTQVIFGLVIAIFPTTMIFAGKIANKYGSRIIAFASGIFFGTGYLLSGFSGGNFYIILLGVGILAGIGTGLGYLVALSTPVKWFPEKKGLITGIAAAGFGLAAFVLSLAIEDFLENGKDILQIFKIIGYTYGLIIIMLSNFLASPVTKEKQPKLQLQVFFSSKFKMLFSGIFFGTFAGLLIIGSLSSIGEEYKINEHILVVSVSVFAVSNFLGRLSWGILSDRIGASISIFAALMLQAISILLLDLIPLNSSVFILLSFLIGFGFGGNFVLFAKETAHLYGVNNLAIIYPFVFLGYALAGIFGPQAGGLLFDFYQNYFAAILLASVMSFLGAILFLWYFLKNRITESPTQ
jgi:OFA family oxalate/formate antiporter-like MFS transporter